MFELRIFAKKNDLAFDLALYVFRGFDISESELVFIEEENTKCWCFYSENKDEVEKIKKYFLDRCAEFLSVDVREISDEWKTNWKSSFVPFDLGKSFRVVPFGKKDNVLCGREEIIIDTDLVFGSGTHATTQLVAEFIETKKGLFEDFFDIGTGTGILAIAAVKCGAEKIWALDISQDAVDTAKKNFAFNHCLCGELFCSDFSKFKKRKSFDFVASNLLTQDLIKFQRKIINFIRPGKYLAVSGISDVNYKEFRDKFDNPLLKCLRVKESNGWYALLFKLRKK